MIIKHIVELETVINDNSTDPSVLAILAMSEEDRTKFFKELGTGFVQHCFDTIKVNEGMSFAELRVAK